MKLNKETKFLVLFVLLCIGSCTETATHTSTHTHTHTNSKSKTNTKIFIAESMFKHKKKAKAHVQVEEASSQDVATAAATTTDTTAAAATTSTDSTAAAAVSATTTTATDATSTAVTAAATTDSTTTAAAATSSTASTSADSTSTGTVNGITSGSTQSSSEVTTNSSSPSNSAMSSSDNSLTDLNLGSGPLYYTSWVKFFKMKPTDVDKKQTFFKNMEYYEQMKYMPGKDYTKDEEFDGLRKVNKWVKSPSHFYTILFRNNLNFITTRDKQIQRTYDILNLGSIDKVEESSGYGEAGPENINGIQEFGNFEEGFCFKVLTGGNTLIWVICTDKMDEKNKMMNMLKKLKIQSQRDHGDIVLETKEVPAITAADIFKPEGLSLSDDGGSMKVDASKNNITDGYWIVLQDWTQCSLKCGGGTQTLQRMCVPPKNGGAPCAGPDIYTRPCNSKACPNSTALHGEGDNNPLQKTLKPVVKVLPFSTRPQRYSKCKIKESDLMYTQNIAELGGNQGPLPQMSSDQTNIQIPCRVVMNNLTITIFAGETYDSQLHSFELEITEMKSSTEHASCFYLVSGDKRAELCPFGFDTTDKTRLEWWDDFNLFKHQCKGNRFKFGLNITDDLALQKKLQEKVAEAKKQVLDDREEELKMIAKVDDENALEADVKASNQVALTAIQKELDLEAMVKREEAEKEKLEVIMIEKKIAEEKKKSDCLISKIKMKEEETKLQLQQRQVAETIASNKAIAAQQITVRRNALKQQITKMKQETAEKKRKLLAQLQQVRTQMSQTTSKAYKDGKQENCKSAVVSDQDRYNYCTANFPDNTDKLGNCKDTDDFCHFCCDNEFGEMLEPKRLTCYTEVCPKPNADGTKTSTSEEKNRWMFSLNTS
jgi:hypothetical protein